MEAFGFATGMWGVWLQALESHWNWPIQLVSSAIYVFVFFGARLYADTTENLIDVVLYGLGWYWWLLGGNRHQRLEIGHLSWRLAGVMAVIGVAGSAVLTEVLIRVHDSAPLLDATTTVASLIATFLMGRKLMEAWWLWILVNLVYIVLYLVRDLQLTAVLYLLFAIFSVIGLFGWKRIERARAVEPAEALT
ncbi:MAG: nicotinamide riboside transporter PnuC [Candidatus Dormibacteraceae bacterium]